MMAVVTDRKITVQGANITCLMQQKPMTDFYIPNVVSYSDYYPFGMQMPQRNDAVSEYRYGFNGMEGDSEMKGSGNSYDFGARMYDSRLGRRWNVDPYYFIYTDLSPYSVFANNPIIIIDVNGDIIKIVGSDAFIAKTKTYLEQINATDAGKTIIDKLENSKTEYTIKEESNIKFFGFDHTLTIKYGFLNGEIIDGVPMTGLTVLAHELYHAFQFETREFYFYKKNGDWFHSGSRHFLERGAVEFENYIRSVYDIGNMRLRYHTKKSWGKEGVFLGEKKSEKDFNPEGEKIKDFKFLYSDPVGGYRGDRNLSDNTQVYVPLMVSKTVSYTKTYSGENGNKKKETKVKTAPRFK